MIVATSAVADVPTDVAVQSKRGQEVYTQVCAACHDQGEGRAPSKAALTQTRSSEFILRALTTGAMRDIVGGLSLEDKKAVATYIIGRPPSAAANFDPSVNRCKTLPVR